MFQIRNILFIMADQLRADHLACYGHPYIKTPNIDALAKHGVRFTRAFVNSGVCGPSRMSFYTGRYPSTHRSEEHTSELQSRFDLVCRLLLEKKNHQQQIHKTLRQHWT